MPKIEIKSIDATSDDAINLIVQLDVAIFPEPLSIGKIKSELDAHTDVIALVSYSNGTPCGFKVGYTQSSKRFFSWIGGVHPGHRGKGIANQLMSAQHEELRRRGYEYVVTHTSNEFKDMLIVNLKHGFSVTGVKTNMGDREPTIIMEKKL